MILGYDFDDFGVLFDDLGVFVDGVPLVFIDLFLIC